MSHADDDNRADIDAALRRVEAGTPDRHDPSLLAGEVRRLRAALLAAMESTTDDAIDHIAELFPTPSAKRLSTKRAEERARR